MENRQWNENGKTGRRPALLKTIEMAPADPVPYGSDLTVDAFPIPTQIVSETANHPRLNENAEAGGGG